MHEPDAQTQTKQKNNKDLEAQDVITSDQSTAIIASTAIGSGILTLPRVAAKYAHEMAWLAVILAMLVSILLVYILTKLALRFPQQTFIEYIGDITGVKWLPGMGIAIKWVVTIFLILYWITLSALTLRILGEFVSGTVLPNTPISLIMLTMLLLTVLSIYYEITVLAKLNEVILPFIVLPVIFFVALSLKDALAINFLPLFAINWESFLKGTFEMIFSFLGFGIMLVLMAYTQKSHNIKSNVVGITIPGFLYLIITVASIAVFGFKELEQIQWPTLELVKSSVISEFIFDRTEAIFIGIWVLAIYTTVLNFYYAGCLSAAQILPLKEKNRLRFIIGLILSPVVYLLAVYPRNLQELYGWLKYVNYVGAATFLLLPLLLLIISVIRGRGEKREANQ